MMTPNMNAQRFEDTGMELRQTKKVGRGASQSRNLSIIYILDPYFRDTSKEPTKS
jgi:hypothetical protein